MRDVRAACSERCLSGFNKGVIENVDSSASELEEVVEPHLVTCGSQWDLMWRGPDPGRESIFPRDRGGCVCGWDTFCVDHYIRDGVGRRVA